MGSNIEGAISPVKQWQRFADSWKRIQDFISSVPIYRHVNVVREINESLRKLSGHMQIYYYEDEHGSMKYRAFRKATPNDEDIIKQTRKEIKALCDSDINWKLLYDEEDYSII